MVAQSVSIKLPSAAQAAVVVVSAVVAVVVAITVEEVTLAVVDMVAVRVVVTEVVDTVVDREATEVVVVVVRFPLLLNPPDQLHTDCQIKATRDRDNRVVATVVAINRAVDAGSKSE
jgi:hypothetical protein